MNSPSITVRFIAILFILPFMVMPECSALARAEPARAEKSFGFDIINLPVAGVMLVPDSGDLNGDGETDMLLFHKSTKETYEKTCSVYFQKSGKFKTTPDAEIPLGAQISAIDIADVDVDGTDELCGFDGVGMVRFELNEDASVSNERVVKCRTLLPTTSRRLIAVDWIVDIDSDGTSDVVLPIVDGIRLFVNRPGTGFVESKTFEVPVRASISGDDGQNYVTHRLPAVRFSDFDGDGRTDIGVFDIEQVDFFLTGGTRMPERHLTARLMQDFTKDFVAAADFHDMNGDGMPDAMLALMSQKKNLESEVRIYFGKPDFSYGKEPAHVYSGTMNVILPIFFDATGDGKKEMLLQNINVGIGFFINYFLANRIKVDAELYQLSPQGRYGKEPVADRAIYISASESGTEPARGVGDFNGDGLDDLAVGTSESKLSFFLSSKETVLPARPAVELSVPSYGRMKTFDLNGDSRTDMVILFRQEDDTEAAVLLLSGEGSK